MVSAKFVLAILAAMHLTSRTMVIWPQHVSINIILIEAKSIIIVHLRLRNNRLLRTADGRCICWVNHMSLVSRMLTYEMVSTVGPLGQPWQNRLVVQQQMYVRTTGGTTDALLRSDHSTQP